MAISDWPAAERPREKLLQRGAAALSDAELLAIFLRTGTPGISAVDLARQLLADFGGLRPLLEAPQAEFCRGHGLGAAKYVQLQAVLEMARRHLAEDLQRSDAMDSPAAVREYLAAQLRHRRREVFCCLFLDTQHRVIAFDELFEGTLNAASVYPREVVQAALQRGAAAVILAHNHPSGVTEPSQADIWITERLAQALALVDIKVLDHMIVGDGAALSFAERGLL
ncbi:RadC family protein [Microbulbifer yueqingensis]|uniref:DNA replication and repair protein RadC n=1 Tax=Microbulbifer yueqingensis TaxID=658219 RepID=A0A1G9BJM3_9GAMM|nr:DNA repair protein RadC [Microbulbifer yueqingensis]SDK39633.1 DNA replication and repair protein RadC [Microbulbifer yueqingensis]